MAAFEEFSTRPKLSLAEARAFLAFLLMWAVESEVCKETS